LDYKVIIKIKSLLEMMPTWNLNNIIKINRLSIKNKTIIIITKTKTWKLIYLKIICTAKLMIIKIKRVKFYKGIRKWRKLKKKRINY